MFNRMCSFGLALTSLFSTLPLVNSAIDFTFQSNGFVKYSETSPLSKDAKRHKCSDPSHVYHEM